VNPNLPVGGSALDLRLGAREALPEDVTQLALTGTYARFASEFQGGDRVDRTAPVLRASLVQLLVRHHFGSGWSADLVVPAGTVRRSATDSEPAQRLSGLGDIEIGGEYDFAALWGPGGYRPSLTLRLALGLPTGQQGTFGDEQGGVPPNVVSIGYGAFGGAAELRLTQFVTRRVGFAPSASVRRPFGPNEAGVTMGTTAAFGLDALLVPWRRVVVTAGASFEARTRTKEEAEGPLDNSGGRTIAGSLAVSARATDRVTLGVGGRLPLYTYANGRQISETYSVQGLFGVSFGGDDHEHAHHHAHGGGHGRPAGPDGPARPRCSTRSPWRSTSVRPQRSTPAFDPSVRPQRSTTALDRSKWSDKLVICARSEPPSSRPSA
jgi:hypothetical protein